MDTVDGIGRRAVASRYDTFGVPRSTLELHSIALDGDPLEARTLRDLPDALAILARQGGLFDQNEALDAHAYEIELRRLQPAAAVDFMTRESSSFRTVES